MTLTVAGLAAAVTTTALIILSTRPDPNSAATEHVSPIARSRSHRPISDCLLTGPAGVQDAIAAAVWAGMQATSATAHVQISYLTIQGPDTTANGEIYINTLAMRGCSVILAAGTIPAQAAFNRAAAWPKQRLVSVTTSALPAPASGTGNLTAISSDDAKTLTEQVKTLLSANGSAA